MTGPGGTERRQVAAVLLLALDRYVFGQVRNGRRVAFCREGTGVSSRNGRYPSREAAAMMGALRCWLAWEPAKLADPKSKIPPSAATRR